MTSKHSRVDVFRIFKRDANKQVSIIIQKAILKLYIILNLIISKALNTEFNVLIVSAVPTSISLFHILVNSNDLRKCGKSDQFMNDTKVTAAVDLTK